MSDPLLDIGNYLTGIGFVPALVQFLGKIAKLDDQVARKILGFDFAPLLPPQAEEGGFISPIMIRASDPPMK